MNQGNLTINEALAIAEREIAEIIKTAPELQGYEFKPVHYWRETDPYWVFSAVSERLIEEGYVPGAVLACVDKTDGHVWSVEEQERHWESVSARRRAAQSDAVAA